MHDYEVKVKKIVDAVYDNATAFSLRDGDGQEDEQLDDLAPVTRMRLNCRASENLLLTTDVLESVGLNWSQATSAMDDWLNKNPTHPRSSEMQAFKDQGYERRTFDLKGLRMLIVGDILASSKPWEVLVGQAIGQLNRNRPDGSPTDDSLKQYLGEKVQQYLLPV